MYKKITFIALLIFITSFLPTVSIQAELVNRIVAVVNDEPITQSELDVLLVPIYEQYRSVYSGQEFVNKMNEARTNILSQLIEDRLIGQEAKRLGVEVESEEINAYVEEIKRKFPDEDAFDVFLDQQDMTMDKLRGRYKDQIAIKKLHQYEVRQKVVVSPLDIEQYYQEHIDELTEKEKVKVKTIMIRKRNDGESGVDEARMRIDKIVQQLSNGASFDEMAKQYSEGMHASDGGALGFVQKDEMISEFDSVLFKLSVGERSDILETELGYHLFLVEAKQGKKVRPLAEVKEDIENTLYRTKAKERFAKWMSELKENAYISIK